MEPEALQMKAILAAAVLALTLACGGPAATTTTHVITGTFALIAATGGTDQNCFGSGGYDDIHAGTPVVVSDESNKVIGTGELTSGTRGSFRCVFGFRVSNLPDAKFYQVEVSHRGKITFSAKDLADKNWHVDLSLG